MGLGPQGWPSPSTLADGRTTAARVEVVVAVDAAWHSWLNQTDVDDFAVRLGFGSGLILLLRSLLSFSFGSCSQESSWRRLTGLRTHELQQV